MRALAFCCQVLGMSSRIKTPITIGPEQPPGLVGLDVNPQAVEPHGLGDHHVALEECVIRRRVDPLGVERLVECRAEVEGLAVEEDSLERLVAVLAAADRAQAEVGLDRVDDLAVGVPELEGRRRRGGAISGVQSLGSGTSSVKSNEVDAVPDLDRLRRAGTPDPLRR